MQVRRKSPDRTSFVFTLVLVMALLCAQWMGLRHSIAHAGWPQGQQSVGSSSSSFSLQVGTDQDGDVHHSCLAFDAATLADSVYTVPFNTALVPNLHVLAQWVAFASWHAPLVCHFSSRAPPLV
jgi:hypothetical protein